MKNQRLLFAGLLLLLAHTLASIAPPPFRLDIPFIEPALEKQPNSGSTEQTSADVCQTASPGVVTIYAGREFGAGSVVSPDGLIITNHHVVKDAKNQQVWVKMIGGSRYQGQITATDAVNDLALVQLRVQDSLPTVRMQDVTNVRIGQQVCAIGSPFNRPGVLTRGTLTTVLSNGDLQSALRLFPGNSGGPLLNSRGEMIGVNKAIWQSRTGENSGISYATNVTTAKAFIEQNRAKSSEITALPPVSPVPSSLPPFGSNAPNFAPQSPTGPRLGVMLDKQTLEIQIVEPNTPAADAGLRAGDRLVAIDNAQLYSIEQLQEFLSRRPNFAELTINRNQQQEKVRVSF